MTDGNLETERLYLRRITLDDADLMLAIWNDPAFVRNVGDRGVRTLEQARDAVRATALKLYAEHGFGPYAVVRKADAVRVGICGLFQRDILDHPDIGFALLPDYCGAGFAAEAGLAVVEYARHELCLERLAGIVSPGNAGSIRLLEKLGLSFDRMITMPGDDHEVCLYDRALGH